MKVARAFGIAFLTGIVGLFLAFFIGDWLTGLYHVSNFEGGRAMLVVFIVAPLGFVSGFVIGFITAVFISGFWKAQGLSLGIMLAFFGLSSGIAWLKSDRTPHINGKNIAIEFEWKIPPTIQIPDQPNDQNIYVSLFAGRRDHERAKLNFAGITVRDGITIVPGRAILNTRSQDRELLAGVGDYTAPAQMFALADLAPSPRAETDWSNWITAQTDNRLNSIPEAERMSMRYRVRVVNDQ